MNKNSSKGFQKGILLTLLAGAGATVFVFLFCFDAVKKKTVRDFEREAVAYDNILAGLIHQAMHSLESVSLFYKYSDFISRDEFSGFILPMISKNKSFAAMFWVPRILDCNRDGIEKRARADGVEQFQVTGSGGQRQGARPTYYPIYYIEPFGLYQGIAGYDLMNEQDVVQAMDKAARSGQSCSIFKPFPLRQGPASSHPVHNDCWVVVPVYDHLELNHTEQAREKSLLGYIMGIIDIHEVVVNTCQVLSGGIQVSIMAQTGDSEKMYIYRQDHENPLSGHRCSGLFCPVYSFGSQLDYSDQSLEINLSRRKKTGYLTDTQFLPVWLILPAGCVLTGLMVLYLQSLYRRNELADRLVVSRSQELKEQKDKADQSAREALQANQAKSAFLASMSHDIRTPMNAIVGFCELLGEEPLGEDQRYYVSIIHESSKSLLMLLNDILDLSKIEAGRMRLEITDCSVRDLLKNIESMLKPAASNRGLDFRIFVPPTLPEIIQSDPGRIRQCLVNLASNAIKFTHAGHVHIKVSAQPHVLRFDVEDTGIGIAADQLDIIFEAFSQADNRTVSQYGGSGLGLTITRQLARMLGGDITVSSQIGHGSVFSLTTPLDSAICSDEAADESTPVTAGYSM
ncbi:MAG: CHASE domain-containing protein [Sedimentisphaerales bacterium]|nr:CHASE domain-containing protein [Sedimentisphaerales bacterium]